MEQYEQIMSIESVLPFVLAYSTHGILAGIQLGLGLAMFFSSVINLLHKDGASWLSHLGFTNNLSNEHKRHFGTLQLIIASLLCLPLIVDVPFLVSLLTFISVAIVYIIYHRQTLSRSQTSGTLSRYAVVVFAIVATTFATYEHSSPLQAMRYIAQDVMTYRPLEQNWQNEFDINAPKAGQQAVEFSLLQSDGKTTSHLSDFLGEKPVVLFLGANSCPVFSAGLADINRLHEKYKSSVNFVGVYVSEPHATDEWPLARTQLVETSKTFFNHPVAIDIAQHTNFPDRLWAADRLKNNLLNHAIPLLVDSMDNAVNNRWVGRPARLYFIGADGRIIYNPGKGPYSFNPLHLEPILDKYLANQKQTKKEPLALLEP
ncbi:hypothetical protein A9Q81_14095 [Gammaproteobacteria bacterium 42_54_T18]|nr:hypothetical protein A9Q81_14095 [Gammaproteobacteria bacterium 42_54_T18]